MLHKETAVVHNKAWYLAANKLQSGSNVVIYRSRLPCSGPHIPFSCPFSRESAPCRRRMVACVGRSLDGWRAFRRKARRGCSRQRCGRDLSARAGLMVWVSDASD